MWQRLPIVKIVLVVAWYVALIWANDYIRNHYDVLDPSEATHMGSTAVEFRYGLVFALVSLVLPTVGALRRAVRARLVLLLLGTCALVIGISTLVFYAGGAAGCNRNGQGPGQDLHFLWLVGASLVLPSGGALLVRRLPPADVVLTLGLGVGAVSSFLLFLQGGHCLINPQQVFREAYALMWFPLAFFAIIALVSVALVAGARIDKRRAAGATPGGSPRTT